MPELPEVETVRRGLEPAMAGKAIRSIDVHRDGLRMPFPATLRTLEGRKVSHLSRRAKYLLIEMAGMNPDILVIHLGMSGRMTIIHDMSAYRRQKHDHLVITMADGAGIAFNDARRFGMVYLMKKDAMEHHAAFKNLGPEPLERDFTGDVLHKKLKARKTPIKLALLDQRTVAGIGNIYACEALFEAGVDPRKPSSLLSVREAEKLVTAIKNVLDRSIKAGGSTLKDYRKADGELGYFQHSFLVYGREGQACPRCGSGDKKKHIIHKITQGGRSTFFCPSCQK